jgi:MoxR-like ATPase
MYLPSMRHRVILNFEAQAENISSDTALAAILNEAKEKAGDVGATVKGGR